MKSIVCTFCLIGYLWIATASATDTCENGFQLWTNASQTDGGELRTWLLQQVKLRQQGKESWLLRTDVVTEKEIALRTLVRSAWHLSTKEGQACRVQMQVAKQLEPEFFLMMFTVFVNRHGITATINDVMDWSQFGIIGRSSNGWRSFTQSDAFNAASAVANATYDPYTGEPVAKGRAVHTNGKLSYAAATQPVQQQLVSQAPPPVQQVPEETPEPVALVDLTEPASSFRKEQEAVLARWEKVMPPDEVIREAKLAAVAASGWPGSSPAAQVSLLQEIEKRQGR